MAKRFGRNQKRKMREALALAQQQEDRAKRELDEVRMITHQGRRAFDRLAALLGRHHFDLPPEIARVAHREVARHYRMPAAPLDTEAALMGSTMAMRHHMVDLLDFAVIEGEVRDHIDGARHLIFEVDGRLVAYAISRKALLTTSPRALAENVHEALWPVIVDLLREDK